MTKEQLTKVRDYLLDLADNEANNTIGICSNIYYDIGIVIGCVPGYQSMLIRWSNYSGNKMYPVPSTITGLTPFKCYYKYFDSHEEKVHHMWHSDYGLLRRDLARHLANEITKML